MASTITKHLAQTYAADGADALPDQSPGIWGEFAGPGSQQAPLLVSANWTNASGGDWSTASDWSNGATPTASTAATISLAGTYTVTITTADTAASLLINDANVTVLDTGYLTLTRALRITAGTFELGYASNIVGGTISTGSSGAFLAEGGGMFNVAYDGTLNMGFSNAGLAMGGTIAFAGANGTGAGVINLTGVGAGINTYGVTSLNNATFNIGGAGTSNSITLYPGSVDATLTLGSNLDMVQSAANSGATIDLDFYYGHTGTLINQGTITAEASGGTFSIIDPYQIGTFVNQGSILVSNGDTFTIAPLTWSNSGSISVTGGELIATGAGYGATFTNTGSIAISGTGTLDVLNSSLTFGAGSSITTTGGGVIIDDTGGTLLGTIGVATNIDFNGGSLAGVTWQGPFSLGASQAVTVSNGLILTGSGSLGLASGAAMYLSGGLTGATALSLASGAVLDVQDTETLDNATLMLAGSGGTLESGTGGYGGPQTTLTLGSGLTVLQSGSGENYLTDGYYLYFSGGYNAAGDSITNNGTISITGGILTANGANSEGTFTNAGVIEVSAGELQLDSVDFSNTGLIAITGTGALDVLYTSLTFAAGGSIIMSDSGSIIDDSGGTLLGTISGATNINFAGGSLAGVTYQGTLSIGASQAVYVSGGLILEGSGGTGAGAVALASGALLDVQDTETLNGGTLTLGGSGATLEIDGSQTTLSLGSGFSILQSGSGQNYLTAGTYHSGGYYGDSIINDGTISITGGTLTAYSNGDGTGTFTNAGIIQVSAGELQIEYSGLTNVGSIAIGGTGALDVYYSSLTFGAGGNITTNGSGVIIDDTGGTLLGTISGTTTNVDFSGGSLAGVTWQGALDVGGGTVYASNGLTLTGAGGTGAGTLNISNSNFIVLDSETLNNAAISFGSSGDGGLFTEGATTQTLTLGANLSVSQTGGDNQLQGEYYGGTGYGSVINDGSINVAGGTLSVLYMTNFTNAGAIAVSNGGLFQEEANNFTNLKSATLNGGRYEADAGSTIQIYSATLLVTDSATIVLSGAGSEIETYNASTGTNITIDQKLTTISTLGALALLAGRNFSASAAFTDNGLLQLGDGTFTASAGLSVASTGTLSGFGTVKANVADAGLVLASGGTLTLAGAISGAGAFGAAAGATLDLTTAETLTQSFTGAGTIKLDGGAYSLPAGAVVSAGTIAVGSGASLSGYGTLTGALLDSGTVDVTGGLVIDGATTGSGTLQISSGATLDIAGGGSFAGAIYGNGGSLYIDGAAPFILQAGASLGNEYIVVDAGATLELTQGGNLNGDIVGAGTLQLDGSTSYIFNNANGFDPVVGTLLVDTGASLNASGSITDDLDVLGTLAVTTGTLFVNGVLSGSGAVGIGAGALLELSGANAAPGTYALTNAISGAGTLELGVASSFAGGTLAVGTLIVGASLAASGTITSAVTVNGTLEATGLLAVTGGLSGAGTLQADAGAVMDIAGGGTLAGTLTGAGTLQLDSGTYTLDGASESVATILVDAGATLATSAGTVLVQGALTSAGAVQIASGALLDLAGGGTLTGAVSGAGTLQIDGAAPLVLTNGSSLSVGATVIDAGATLDLHANEILPATISGAGILTLDGTFTLGTNKPAMATLQIDAGASLTGVGTLASVIDNGTLATTRGTLALTSGLAGNGALSLATGSVLDLRAGGSFAGTSSGAGTLQIDGATPLALTGASLHTVVSVHGGSTLSGFGTLVGAISDAGAISASGGKLILAGAVSGAGALAASAGATLALSGGGTLAQSISGAGTLQLSGAYTLGVHTPATAAVILSAGASLSGAGRLVGSLTDNGTLLANGGTLALARGVSGLGTLSVSAGSTLSLGAASSFSGLVTGAGEVDINANLSLSGAASLSAADVLLSANLVQASGDSLNILAGNSLTLSAAAGHIVTVQGAANDRLSNAGTLAAAGAGSAKVSEAFVNAGLVTSNAATLSFLGAATNNGSITAASGLTSFSALIGGSGTDQIGAAGTLSLLAGASAGQTIDFLASTGALDLTKPASFLGTISGFGGSDAIDLVKTPETSFGFSNGVLTVMNGKATVATLNFAGSYTTSDFTLGSDGHGGTAVAFV
jgi:hypothetical protein